MLGLNLNTNMPFSPASGFTHQVPNIEEEVDAVTGMMDVIFMVFGFSMVTIIPLCVYPTAVKG